MASQQQPACWYFVSNSSQPVGPYDAATIAAYAPAGYFTEATLFWKEGRTRWDKLEDIEELKVLVNARKAATSRPDAGAGNEQDALASFKSEIAATEADVADGDGPATPEELEFEDDDGTVYEWDRKLRKFVAQGDAGAQGPEAGTEDAWPACVALYATVGLSAWPIIAGMR